MKPFIMVSTRPEQEAAEAEFESFLSQGGLAREELQHVQIAELDILASLHPEDVSGVIIGGSPYDASTPNGSKTRTQLRVEEEVREILAQGLKDSVPVLATGFGLEVLATYLGTSMSPLFGEHFGTTELFLTEAGREDPLLAGLPQTFTVLVGHHEGAVDVPAHATLLASSPDCPVQMIRVGRGVYGTQFNPELDGQLFAQRASVYTDAGYGTPDLVDDVLELARSSTEHLSGRIIRNFVEHFARD
ncbi:GMP synthase [glutamine-hydrolyzing] [Actinomyces bovis]|uniref:GMP synthase [glutamine-hydrolyzing] n=1 Tax=Actinomyces bovis TaxID=1658 RepID=A0ABY1VNL7_9ACTO|nr:hypothetical protein [Actinomyces bovis]SPT53696.1 GMP synthase [glutamine-hydrolyzing] [Actinomyces bovis]VEG55822.1 GMP synthase [glutamine-hydrolyzing] [Actinomyces israelii]